MKKANKMLICCMFLGISALIGCQVTTGEPKAAFKHIDLPEEAKLISNDQNNPDKMVAWVSNDTLHLGFAPHNIHQK